MPAPCSDAQGGVIGALLVMHGEGSSEGWFTLISPQSPTPGSLQAQQAS